MVSSEQASELGRRWARARRAALLEVLAEPPEVTDPQEEEALRVRAQAVDLADTYRRLFDNSQRLGHGFARFHRATVRLDELPGLLAQLGVPCLRGAAALLEGEPALSLTRAGCGAAPTALGCDYWREAIDGLVIGLTDGLRWTRHRSQGHGDPHCVDVAYADPESVLRFGFLPVGAATEEAAVRQRLHSLDPKAEVAFLGVSEGVLSYELTHRGCGGTAQLKGLVESHLKRAFPSLVPREVSPRAVLEPDGA